MPKISRRVPVITVADRLRLAGDIAPENFHKRAAMINLALIDVALVGKAAVLTRPKVKDTHRRPRQTDAQVRQTGIATFRAKQAAEARRQA